MKKRLLFCSLIGLFTACRNETDIVPTSSLANEIAGTYRTNVYLDPSTVAIPADQMPYITIKAESDSSVTILFTKFYPTKESRLIEHVRVSQQADGVRLRVTNGSIGALQTDRIFTNNGMEKQGKLLRLNGQNTVEFVGAK